MTVATPLPSLRVQNFRSHRDRTIHLGPLTVLAGPNGIGKTNLLEALWLLATTRSFRTHREAQAIHWDASAASVRAADWEYVLLREPLPTKVFKIRGVIQRPIDYLGHLRAVLFTPDSFRLILGGPEERRRWLDTVLAQNDRASARLLLYYRQIIRQRNSLLRTIALSGAGRQQLPVWDHALVQTGTALTAARRALLADLLPYVAAGHTALSRRRASELILAYLPGAPETAAGFERALAAQRDREIRLQATLVGPHRDDLAITLAGHPAAEHASRGELRRILLALKAAEVRVLSSAGAPVILLLDDVLSELDAEHRAALAGLVALTQTVLTTADLAALPKLSDATSVIDLAAAGGPA